MKRKLWHTLAVVAGTGAAALLPARLARAQAERGDATAIARAAGKADLKADLTIAKAVAPSLVRVEYTLKFHNGEAPQAAGWSQRCPNCGGYHGNSSQSVVEEERPFEVGGFLVSDDTVVTPDPLLDARFIQRIAVRFGDETVDATPAAFGRDQAAVLLKLSKPLKAAKPLAFDKARAGPYSAVTYALGEGDWIVRVAPAGGAVSLTAAGRPFVAVPSFALLVDAAGRPVGVSMKDEIPTDDSWKGSPADWPVVTAADLAAATERTGTAVGAGLVRVTLNFRSPKARPGQDRFAMRSRGGDDDENATVRHATGVLVDDRTVLVLANLRSNVTARLEGVRVQQAGGKPAVQAKFARTLADYGAFVATLESPLTDGAAVKPAAGELLQLPNVLLHSAEVRLQGDQRVEHLGHRRVAGLKTGWRRQLYPTVPGEAKDLFLFDRDGALVALPIVRRAKASLDDGNGFSYGRDQAALTPARYVWEAAAGDPAKYADAGNAPLSEEQENRLAWLGVELQPLTPDLARANDVAALTNDGQSGALVTYVYPGSPAEKAGVEPGHVLLRIHVPDQPKPMDVRVEQSPFGDQPFPWDRFDELSEQYFDQVPQPWPAAENTLTRALTDLGFGKAFEAEFFKDGKAVRKPFAVVQSPAHYDSAPRYKLDPLGVTVKDLSYEVRRYFQVPESDPGVIIAKIEMGSRGSTAGLKPFELVTHVNDQPVRNVKEFEAAAKGQEALRLSVKRMTRGRQVDVKLSGKPAAAGEKKPDGPGPKPEGPDAEPEAKPDGKRPAREPASPKADD